MSEPKVFAPRGPELGLLQRSRDWIDVMPWLCLSRVLRLAGSPIWLSSVAAVWWLWSQGSVWMFGDDVGNCLTKSPWLSLSLPGDLWIPLPLLSDGLSQNPLLNWREIEGWVFVAWTLFCWTPIAMVLTRLGGWLAAGRQLPGFGATIRAILPRIVSGWLVAILPIACAAPSLLLIGAIHFVLSGRAELGWTSLLIPVLAIVSFVAALLIVPGKFSVPLAWASLAIEPQSDSLDGLSRGYEYVLRRAPRTVLLVLVATTQVALVAVLWFVVAQGAEQLNGKFESDSLGWATSVQRTVAITLGWGMIGGIYLLLRQSAGGQEVEDIQ